MGQTKKLLEQMDLQELIMLAFNSDMDDDDYQYELWKERRMEQEEQERLAYEEMNADRY